MQLPLQITFRHMEHSAALEARVRQRAEELDQFFDRIISCRVVVECSHRRHQQGNIFEVRVDLTVPGREIVVGREPGVNHAHEDPYVAVRDAFDKLEIGSEVRFVAQYDESAEGPQASTVVPLGKHHLPPTEAVRST